MNEARSNPTTVFVKPWDWRRGYGCVHPGMGRGLSPDVFHAYDVNDNAACAVDVGLIESRDQPNEGSELCNECVAFIKANCAGREKRK